MTEARDRALCYRTTPLRIATDVSWKHETQDGFAAFNLGIQPPFEARDTRLFCGIHLGTHTQSVAFGGREGAKCGGFVFFCAETRASKIIPRNIILPSKKLHLIAEQTCAVIRRTEVTTLKKENH